MGRRRGAALQRPGTESDRTGRRGCSTRRHGARLCAGGRRGVPRLRRRARDRSRRVRRRAVSAPARYGGAVRERDPPRRRDRRIPPRRAPGGARVSAPAATNRRASVSSSSPPRRRRAAITWVAIAAGFIVVGIVGSLLAGIGERAARGSLDPESAGPGGTRALAEVLRNNGVEVVVERSWQNARDLLEEQDATLFLPDTPNLSAEAVESLVETATATVFGDPASRVLRTYFDGAVPTGFATETLAPACALPTPARAGDATIGGLFSAGGAQATCYPDGEAYGLLGSGSVTAIDADGVFTNDALADEGNAALAIGLLGAHERVVWYVASAG
ncbi:MAG TPA: hypothetical protein DEA59_05050, partial [Microbacterium sp.]|nr:hypothetical protein [Microbacterium sp.]